MYFSRSVGLPRKLASVFLELLVEAQHAWRQQAAEVQAITLFVGERGALVECRIVKERHASIHARRSVQRKYPTAIGCFRPVLSGIANLRRTSGSGNPVE